MNMYFRTRVEAEADLKKWKATLPDKGKKWKSDVWDNCGWHWCLVRGPFSVYKALDGEFHTLLASDMENETRHGCLKWDGKTHAPTPFESVQLAAKLFREYAEAERALLERMEQFVESVVSCVNA